MKINEIDATNIQMDYLNCIIWFNSRFHQADNLIEEVTHKKKIRCKIRFGHSRERVHVCHCAPLQIVQYANCNKFFHRGFRRLETLRMAQNCNDSSWFPCDCVCMWLCVCTRAPFTFWAKNDRKIKKQLINCQIANKMNERCRCAWSCKGNVLFN